MSAWEKRLTRMTLRAVEQNISLGAQYFRREALSSGPAEVGVLRLDSGVEVLEEVSSHGSVVIALPDERHVAVYAVDAGSGTPTVAWYERTELLVGV
jgi:hypothetical protein